MPHRFKTALAPIPDLSRIVGEPNAPAEMTTSFDAITVLDD
jgi:hypothetical protein